MPALDPKARALMEGVSGSTRDARDTGRDGATGEFESDDHGVVNGHHHGPDVRLRLHAVFTSDEEDRFGDGLDGGGDWLNALVGPPERRHSLTVSLPLTRLTLFSREIGTR